MEHIQNLAEFKVIDMNRRLHNLISSICSGQTVLALLVTYLIILFYIIPSAHQEAIVLSGLDLDGSSYFKYCRLSILSNYAYLNEEFRSSFLSTEFTAGIFEVVSLFAFVLAFQIYVQSRLRRTDHSYEAKFSIVLIGFAMDAFQSLASIYLIGLNPESRILVSIIFFLAVAKIVIYSYVTLTAARAWIRA